MLYRGRLAFDPPPQPRLSEGPPAPKRRPAKRPEGVVGKWRCPELYREWKRSWREKHHEHLIEYNREYYRKYLSKAAHAKKVASE